MIFPYIKATKERLGLTDTQKTLLIYDVFTGQKTYHITDIIESNDCVSLCIPNNLTHEFQMLDLNIYGHAKRFLNTKFELWYAQEIAKQLSTGMDIRGADIPVKLSIIKSLHAQWLIGLYDYLRNQPDMILKAFEMSGLTEAMQMDLPDENPFADLL